MYARMRMNATLSPVRRAALSLVAAAVLAPAAQADVLVALRPSAPPPAGARAVAPALGIWSVKSARGLHGVLAEGPNRRMQHFERAAGPTDPLLAQEWWWQAVGADRVQPPSGPSKPVAVVDTGVDVTHPEFSALNVLLLDQQHVTPGPEEHHGTAVASIVAAPADGKGMVGVYPGAALMSYDAGGETLAEVLGGIASAIAQPGPGVINLSVGFSGSAGANLLQIGVDSAVAAGWLVVAAAGNDGVAGGPVYPADLPHVLTVAATDRGNAVASFSSRSRFVDLAAPGVSVLGAVPTWKDPNGYALLTGTSFAAPIVSGAAAMVWTARPTLDATQVGAILRSSAMDLDVPGRDPASGFGLLDLPAALAAPAPFRDPDEPNDDVDLVATGGEFGVGTPPLVTGRHLRNRVAAQLDYADDPADVYRVFVPWNEEVVARVLSGAGVRLGLWGPRTSSIHEPKPQALRDLIGAGRTVKTRNASSRKGSFYYLAATLTPGTQAASYLVDVQLRARP
jgi:hypothetical protein